MSSGTIEIAAPILRLREAFERAGVQCSEISRKDKKGNEIGFEITSQDKPGKRAHMNIRWKSPSWCGIWDERERLVVAAQVFDHGKPGEFRRTTYLVGSGPKFMHEPYTCIQSGLALSIKSIAKNVLERLNMVSGPA